MPNDPSIKRASARTVLAFIVTATLALLTLSAVGAFWFDDQGWDVYPAWLEAFATLAALIAAGVAAVFAARAFRIEQAREDRTANELTDRAMREKRAQADQVAGWFRRNGLTVRLANQSFLPIYDVDITLHSDDVQLRLSRPFLAVPPTDANGFGLDDRDNPRWETFLGYGVEHGIRVAFEFRDAAGRRWRRSEVGKLTLLEDVPSV